MATAASLAPHYAADGPPLQRVGVFSEVPRLLHDLGVDPLAVLNEVGLRAGELDNIEGRLPVPLVSDLILKCVEATGREDFPLVLGALGRLRHLGTIGTLLTQAPDFGSALRDFIINHPRYVRGAVAYLIDWKEQNVLVAHRVHHPGLRGSGSFSVGAVAFGCKAFAELCGVEPTQVLVSLPVPDDIRAYKRAFGRAKLIFGAEHFGLVYSRASLKRAIPTADPSRYAETRSFVAEHWVSLQPDIRERVMRVLVPMVLDGMPSLAKTAELLNTHPRTLNRNLNARGMTFREAVNEARFEMASQLLRDTRVSIGGLARTLGYSEVSAFTRFFTSMAGISPTEWKQREGARPQD